MKNKKPIIVTLVLALMLLASMFFLNKQENQDHFNKGAEYGFDIALDTLSTIIQNQVKSDSTVTQLQLQRERDTITYYLSKKLLDESSGKSRR